MQPVTAAIVAATAANAIVILGGLFLWLSYRSRRAREQENPQAILGLVEARLEELTRAVEVVAVEVERLGEAQRYLAAQDRSGTARPADPQAGRVITPH